MVQIPSWEAVSALILSRNPLPCTEPQVLFPCSRESTTDTHPDSRQCSQHLHTTPWGSILTACSQIRLCLQGSILNTSISSLCVHLSSPPACYMPRPTHPHSKNIWWTVGYKLWSSLLWIFIQPPVTSSYLGLSILLSDLLKKTINLRAYLTPESKFHNNTKERTNFIGSKTENSVSIVGPRLKVLVFEWAYVFYIRVLKPAENGYPKDFRDFPKLLCVLLRNSQHCNQVACSPGLYLEGCWFNSRPIARLSYACPGSLQPIAGQYIKIITAVLFIIIRSS